MADCSDFGVPAVPVLLLTSPHHGKDLTVHPRAGLRSAFRGRRWRHEAGSEDVNGVVTRPAGGDGAAALMERIGRRSVERQGVEGDAIARLEIPVLILQGTTDLQVKVEDANRLAAAKPGARLIIIEGMNHVLKAASGTLPQQMPSYGDPSLPIVPRLISETVSFVKSLPRR